VISESSAEAMRRDVRLTRESGQTAILFGKYHRGPWKEGQRKQVIPGLWGEVARAAKAPKTVIVAVKLYNIERWLDEVEIVPDSDMPNAGRAA
jgi:hypothetical protein